MSGKASLARVGGTYCTGKSRSGFFTAYGRPVERDGGKDAAIPFRMTVGGVAATGFAGPNSPHSHTGPLRRKILPGRGSFASKIASSTSLSDEHLGAFIRRPVATSLLTVALLLAGAVAFRLLPVAPLPEVEYPTIQVSANLPGASPETMASAVATPLERMFGRIAGITR